MFVSFLRSLKTYHQYYDGMSVFVYLKQVLGDLTSEGLLANNNSIKHKKYRQTGYTHIARSK